MLNNTKQYLIIILSNTKCYLAILNGTKQYCMILKMPVIQDNPTQYFCNSLIIIVNDTTKILSNPKIVYFCFLRTLSVQEPRRTMELVTRRNNLFYFFLFVI